MLLKVSKRLRFSALVLQVQRSSIRTVQSLNCTNFVEIALTELPMLIPCTDAFCIMEGVEGKGWQKMVRARELLPVPEAAYKYKAQGGCCSIEAFAMSSKRIPLSSKKRNRCRKRQRLR